MAYDQGWLVVVPDDCTCKWINYSDWGVWYLQQRDTRCPRHGDN